MGKVLGSPRENRSDSRARSRVAPSATATTARALVAMVVLISGWMFGVLSDPGMAGAATAVTLNPNGGATSADGLKITTADGELQVVRSGTGQLYGPTMSPPSLVNNYFALAVGTSPTGVLFLPPNAVQQLEESMNWLRTPRTPGIISTRSFTNIATTSTATGFKTTMDAVYNVLTYVVSVTGTYRSPDDFLTLAESVSVPQGNTMPVKLYHVLDTYFAGSDRGPGYYKAPSEACSASQLGVFQGSALTPSTPVEAMQNVGGCPGAPTWRATSARSSGRRGRGTSAVRAT